MSTIKVKQIDQSELSDFVTNQFSGDFSFYDSQIAYLGSYASGISGNNVTLSGNISELSGDLTASNTVAQVQVFKSTATASTSGIIPIDNTTPQSTEGLSYQFENFTPLSDSSNLFIEFNSFCSSSQTGAVICSMFYASGADAIGVGISHISYSGAIVPISVYGETPSISPSSNVIEIRFGSPDGNLVNMLTSTSGDIFNTAKASYLKVTEIR